MIAAASSGLKFVGRIEHGQHAILGGDDVLDLRAKAGAIQSPSRMACDRPTLSR